jgi:NAD(P)-dependent dehydrogenase (short-subunit alcohol dehydrogenase family)
MRLQGKVAVITGGANGIGRATSQSFARQGARVVVADLDVDAGNACVAAIREAGGEALFATTDVSSDDDTARLADVASSAFDVTDILVNCAGVAISGSVVDTEPERWQRVLDVNLASIYRTCRALVPGMVAGGGGAIVNVASIQGLYGWRGYAGYAASKAGIIGLTRQIAVEYADDFVRANCVSPGGIVTELGANSARLEPGFTSPQAGDSAVPNPPAADSSSGPKPAPVPRLRGPGRAEDVAAAILFLASDEAAHISGQNLIVDGISTSHVA